MLPNVEAGSAGRNPITRRRRESNPTGKLAARLTEAMATVEQIDAQLRDGKKRNENQLLQLRGLRTQRLRFISSVLKDYVERKETDWAARKESGGAKTVMHVEAKFSGGHWDLSELGPNLTPAERLKRLRRSAGYSSMQEAADAMRVSVATYRRHEAGNVAISKEFADIYSGFFKLPPGVILYGNRLVIYPDALPNHQLQAIGMLNEHGKIHPFPRPDDPRRTIHFRVPILSKMTAVYIDTGAFAPTYCKGDYVFADVPLRYEVGRSLDHLIGRECFVTLDHGRKTIASLGQPQDEHHHFITLPNRPPVLRHVHTASLVRWIKRASDDG